MKREDLADLLSFATIAEERSFTQAAVRLGVSSSALSHAIRLLEERLGAKLLHKTIRNVPPTAARKKLLDQLKPAFTNIETGLTMLAEERNRPAGHIRISVHRAAATLLVLPKLERLRCDYPDIVLELAIEDSLTNIVASGFDAGIRNGELLAKDMVAVRIGPDYRTAVVAAPSYLKNSSPPATPRDLGRHACFGYRRPASGTLHVWEFGKNGRTIQVPVESVFIANDSDVLVQAALRGNGLAYVLKGQIEQHLASGALVEVLEDWSIMRAGSFLYYPDRRQLPASMRIVIEALRYRGKS
jgi:DNA-binding transcriptional LysR family regulator